MRVFILEDDPLRMVSFRSALQGHEIDHAVSCLEVDIFKPPYNVILLDHDLGGRQMTEHEDNGEAFVDLIIDKINPSANILIHSYNLDGANRMLAKLNDRNLRATREFFGPRVLRWLKALAKDET